jgi:hypothetical protein
MPKSRYCTIAGEINLDLILYGLPLQMPTWSANCWPDDFTITFGSSSAILAHNLAALGSQRGVRRQGRSAIHSELSAIGLACANA